VKVVTSNYFNFMRIVGVKRLKARLSEYLRAVRSGETFLVTDRDEVVAELRPATDRTVKPEAVEDVLHTLSEKGSIVRAKKEKGDWHWHVDGLGLKTKEVDALLGDLRSDRTIGED